MPDDIIKPNPGYDVKGEGAATPTNNDSQTPTDNPANQTAATAAPIINPVPETPVAPLVATPNIQAETDPEAKIKAAMLAMEGPERTARREQKEKTRDIKEEKAKLSDREEEIVKQKKQLELAWINLDEQRQKLKTALAPLLEQEKQVEEEEQKDEEEENKTGLTKEKHLVEEKRWAAQQKRKQIEDEKWKLEEKIIKLEEAIETNTVQYRTLLDEEDQVQDKLDQLEGELL